ncbi:MAG: DUF3365 domain-containing protein, partial [bacterium]
LKLAKNTGRQIFEEIVIARMWNAQHGGVYVPVTEKIQPNPYLDDPLRDIYTTEGMLLTKINPAYMTRSIAELVFKDKKTFIHLTSLDPIRPENAAALWEKEAFQMFDKGESEYYMLDEAGDDIIFRYMAPLITEKPCLKCHAQQGYSVGDIRGGLSVSFSYSPFLSEISRMKIIASFTHLGLAILSLAIIGLLGVQITTEISKSYSAMSNEIKLLEGLLPICMYCKKIRNKDSKPEDPESWSHLEKYISDHSEAIFSHGMCPECRKKMFPDKE